MRDEIPLAIDQIGIAGPTKLNISDHIPKGLEIRLSRGHSDNFFGRKPYGDRDGHIRLGLIRCVDWTDVSLA